MRASRKAYGSNSFFESYIKKLKVQNFESDVFDLQIVLVLQYVVDVNTKSMWDTCKSCCLFCIAVNSYCRSQVYRTLKLYANKTLNIS